MMHILLAPDAFKGSLTAREAVAAMAAGIQGVRPDAELICMPMADGGEGTLDVLQAVYGGLVRDEVLYVNHSNEAFSLIESARLIGLMLPAMQRDVYAHGSAALGAAIIRALDAGVRDIRIALGGSATVDGGLGLLQALGCRVLDGKGAAVSPDLNGLLHAEHFALDGLDARLRETRLTLLCDVQNPLCGEHGAVHAYGRQKGIADEQLAGVDKAMRHWAGLCEQRFAVSAAHEAGAGAAGGLGFALQLLGAHGVSGAAYVMQANGFASALSRADHVLTGEGCSDAQTLHGKLPWHIARAARAVSVPVTLISGDIVAHAQLRDHFDCLLAARPAGISTAMAMERASEYVRATAAQWAATL